MFAWIRFPLGLPQRDQQLASYYKTIYPIGSPSGSPGREQRLVGYNRSSGQQHKPMPVHVDRRLGGTMIHAGQTP